MGRPPLYEPAALVGAAQALAAAGSAASVTIAAVAAATGAPVGSIYHRFGSRDDLLAAAWLEALSAFQAGFIPALWEMEARAGAAAAAFTTSWARREPTRGRILVLHHAREFGFDRWQPSDRDRARVLSAELEAGLAGFCERHLGASGGDHRRLATFALLDLPNAAVRRYLAAGIPPPEEVDRYVSAALAALLPGQPGN